MVVFIQKQEVGVEVPGKKVALLHLVLQQVMVVMVYIILFLGLM